MQADDWQKRLDRSFAENVAKLSDRDLLTALDGAHHESPEYEIILAEVRRRHLDI